MPFKIPNVPPTTNKSVRFPNDMLEEIEEAYKVFENKVDGVIKIAVKCSK